MPNHIYIDVTRSKAKLSLIFMFYSYKIYNRVMLIGDANGNGVKKNLISEKKSLHIMSPRIDL